MINEVELKIRIVSTGIDIDIERTSKVGYIVPRMVIDQLRKQADTLIAIADLIEATDL